MKPFTYKSLALSKEEFSGVETIQMDIENNLPLFLGEDSENINLIVVVGAWRGDEVRSFLKYKNANIVCFEPNPKNFAILQNRYLRESRVTCLPYACGPDNTRTKLHEADVTGNDSLLEINEAGRKTLKETHMVEVRRLDDVEILRDKNIDLLWMDVQGYEKNVLLGAKETLNRTTSIFLEVSKGNKDYKGSTTYSELTSILITYGFNPIADGFDEHGSDGNAFFSRSFVSSSFLNSFEDRLSHLIHSKHLVRKIVGFRMLTWIIARIPTRLKLLLKDMLGI